MPRGTKRGIDKVEVEKVAVIEKVKKDFFGRVIVEEVACDEEKRRRTESSHGFAKIQPDVWVRYHEGYSSAVRKPVIFAELLGRV
jgi:chromosome transmission fidelity protein 18